MKFQSLVLVTICAAALGACGSEAPSGPAKSGAATQTSAEENAAKPDQRPAAFSQCAVCHAVTPEARRMIGPTLAGVVGATAGQQPDFAYSQAMRDSDVVWSQETLDAFLENPQSFTPGNRMAYAGERNPERRAAIITYLMSLHTE